MQPSVLGQPGTLWDAFFGLCAVPRPSGHEAAAAAWVIERAKRAGFEARSDAVGNVLVRKPASPGREAARRLILQAHLDMVPQKAEGSPHDFLRDPIVPRIDPDDPAWLRASGTTLGADDGIGVAAAFAVLEDAKLVHGPLDAIFTVNEESGMTGARGIESAFLAGDLLVNLDGEKLDEICVGSATGERMAFRLESEAGETDKPGTGAVLIAASVSGLRGGHSGGDIHLGRANAITSLARVVAEAVKASGARLVSVEGGSVPNAIPREARAVFALDAACADAFVADLERAAAELRARHRDAEPDLRVAAGRVEKRGGDPLRTFDAETGSWLFMALAAAPDGLRSMMEGMDDVARLSSNIGLLRSAVAPDGRLVVEGMLLARGAYEAELDVLCGELEHAFESGGFAVRRVARTLGWSPDFGSPLLAAAREAWTEALGAEPAARATHGGLECGLLRAARPGLDMISVGPDIRFPHSPDEAVRVESVGRFY
ncbi:MAG: beta-Ala-His dipeptidase, partial [Spirochaetales bacterium]|nr:beta-Ala-His dipeptidase [Spirochaetales bacterium]